MQKQRLHRRRSGISISSPAVTVFSSSLLLLMPNYASALPARCSFNLAAGQQCRSSAYIVAAPACAAARN
jgi:hypothetical protein